MEMEMSAKRIFRKRYPHKYVVDRITKDGHAIQIRPIRPDDGSLLERTFSTLSPRSICNGFHGYIQAVPEELITKLTHIDYRRVMALLAIDKYYYDNIPCGWALYVQNDEESFAEVAVLVGDPWQGKGIGLMLIDHLAAIARDQGIGSLWGQVLAHNIQMHNLLKKMGCDILRDLGGDEFEIGKNLTY